MNITQVSNDEILVFEDGSWMTYKDFKESFKPYARRLDNGVDENDNDVTG